ncbi:hypothetical protein OXPF_00840 [Oxobacter pfennigii]|uniref:HTH IS408-type domain-containing protein n=1 Tax=Oxobacter pfennigii TaxID=36849 RepID=A0A0P8WC77_9CLOT|nr:transposase [Oxobacter pfennigii]KPU46356.1 hypothetical protein OXPF_00840 [Oxobacter pfennigii]
MTKYREILRLHSLGFTQRNIMQSCGVAQKTVVRVLRRANELTITWPLDETITDAVLEGMMFPKADKDISTKRKPDFVYIHKELLKK